MHLLGSEGKENEGTTVIQFGLTGERIVIKQTLFLEPTISQEHRFNDHSIKTEILEKETKKRSITDILETTTQLNTTEQTVTQSPEQAKSNAIITTSTTVNQLQKEEIITEQ